MSYEDERKFLHDVANPLSIAHGNVRIAIRKVEALKDANPELREILERLSKAMEACEKMAKQLGERRQAIVERESNSAAS